MRALFILSLIITVTAALPAAAEETIRKEGETLLTLSVSERAEVTQELLIANLNFRAEGKTPQEVQQSINSAMKKATDYAKRRPTLEVRTGHYNVRPNYTYRPQRNGGRERVIDGWQGSQALTLESEDAEVVTRVAGQIQEMGFAMNGLNFQVSSARAEEVRSSLLEKAVRQVKEKGRRIAAALGKNTVEVATLQIGGGGGRPRHYNAMAMAEGSGAKMADPVAEPGEQTITLTLSAQVIIK